PAPPARPAPVGGTAAAPPAAGPGGGVVDQPRFRGHGIGMSQYGALAKAQRGAKAAAILASYYPGARVAHLPPERLPATIKVALEPVRSSMVVTGPGRFRLLDGSGRAMAVAATGAWRIGTAPHGKIRVTPPPGQDAAPVLEPIGYEPQSPAPGSPVTVRLRLSAPAMVGARVDGPAGPAPVASGSQFMEAGEWPLALPPLARPGRHVVSIVADAGADRVTTVPFTIAVSEGSDQGSTSAMPDPTRRSASSPPVRGLGLVALGLWVSVVLAGRRRAPSLRGGD
ncbi:MAG: hypothetical protein M3N68_13225, partial [Actinomycetota bacterium]|nr:hypothetical protein [Actinomycetota bacterium]